MRTKCKAPIRVAVALGASQHFITDDAGSGCVVCFFDCLPRSSQASFRKTAIVAGLAVIWPRWPTVAASLEQLVRAVWRRFPEA